MKCKNILIKRFFLSLFLISLVLYTSDIRAQITVPNGNTLNLSTNNDFLYIETRVYFNTGIYTPNDYKWEKIFDSLDNRWFFTACFNGECRNELADSGNFINDYGLNDTTAFIAFHVETYKYDGSSKIRYKVYNKYDSSDQEYLTFNIEYKNNTDISEYPGIYPYQIKIINPAIDAISVMNLNSSIGDIFLYDALGREVCTWNSPTIVNDKINLDLPLGLSGVFILKMSINGILNQQKIIINQ